MGPTSLDAEASEVSGRIVGDDLDVPIVVKTRQAVWVCSLIPDPLRLSF